jgi:phosphate starvation-inducible membrane PsiE
MHPFKAARRAFSVGRLREGCKLKIEKAEELRQHMHGLAESLGNLLVEGFHYMALFAIGGVTAWAAVHAFFDMVAKGHISIDDILLLFIYLELGAMVGIYFKTNHMPIRFLIYVAITALTRLMIGDISHNHTPTWGVVMVSGAILLLAVSNLVVRYASSRFPSEQSDSPSSVRRRFVTSKEKSAATAE